jgi:hypothetical protein
LRKSEAQHIGIIIIDQHIAIISLSHHHHSNHCVINLWWEKQREYNLNIAMNKLDVQKLGEDKKLVK